MMRLMLLLLQGHGVVRVLELSRVVQLSVATIVLDVPQRVLRVDRTAIGRVGVGVGAFTGVQVGFDVVVRHVLDALHSFVLKGIGRGLVDDGGSVGIDVIALESLGFATAKASEGNGQGQQGQNDDDHNDGNEPGGPEGCSCWTGIGSDIDNGSFAIGSTKEFIGFKTEANSEVEDWLLHLHLGKGGLVDWHAVVVTPGAIRVFQLDLGDESKQVGGLFIDDEGGFAGRLFIVNALRFGDQSSIDFGGDNSFLRVLGFTLDITGLDLDDVLGVLLQTGNVARIALMTLVVPDSALAILSVILNSEAGVVVTAIESRVPSQSDGIEGGKDGPEIGGIVWLAFVLQFDNGLLLSNLVGSFAGVIAIAGVSHLQDRESGLVHVIAEGSEVDAVVVKILLDRGIVESPIESGLRKGLHPTADGGSFSDIKGHFVVPVDDHGRVFNPQEHGRLGLSHRVLKLTSVVTSISGHDVLARDTIRTDESESGENVETELGQVLLAGGGDLEDVGVRVEDLSAILEPLDSRLRFAHCTAGHVKSGVTLSLHDGGLKMSHHFGLLMYVQVRGADGALALVVGGLTEVGSGMVQLDRSQG